MTRLDEIAQRVEVWLLTATDYSGQLVKELLAEVRRLDAEKVANQRFHERYKAMAVTLEAEVRSLQAENEAAHRVLSQAGVTRGGGPDGADPIIFDLPSRLHGLLEEQLEVRAEVRSLQQQLADAGSEILLLRQTLGFRNQELSEAQQQIAALQENQQ